MKSQTNRPRRISRSGKKRWKHELDPSAGCNASYVARWSGFGYASVSSGPTDSDGDARWSEAPIHPSAWKKCSRKSYPASGIDRLPEAARGCPEDLWSETPESTCCGVDEDAQGDAGGGGAKIDT